MLETKNKIRGFILEHFVKPMIDDDMSLGVLVSNASLASSYFDKPHPKQKEFLNTIKNSKNSSVYGFKPIIEAICDDIDGKEIETVKEDNLYNCFRQMLNRYKD